MAGNITRETWAISCNSDSREHTGTNKVSGGQRRFMALSNQCPVHPKALRMGAEGLRYVGEFRLGQCPLKVDLLVLYHIDQVLV